MEWILLGLIVLYAGWVIYKRVKDFKKGKYCSCGCSDCQANCHKKK